MPKVAEIEDTPNPNALKVTLREPLSWGVRHSYVNAAQAEGDVLARAVRDRARPRGRRGLVAEDAKAADPVVAVDASAQEGRRSADDHAGRPGSSGGRNASVWQKPSPRPCARNAGTAASTMFADPQT
jgi:hypothetical protein